MLHRWPGPAGKAKHTKKKKKEMLFNMAVTDSKILKKQVHLEPKFLSVMRCYCT